MENRVSARVHRQLGDVIAGNWPINVGRKIYLRDSDPDSPAGSFFVNSMALMAGSLIIRWLGFGEAAVLMAGLASAAFHVGAGALTLRSCGGCSRAAGPFLAPWGIWVCHGGRLPGGGPFFFLSFLFFFLGLF